MACKKQMRGVVQVLIKYPSTNALLANPLTGETSVSIVLNLVETMVKNMCQQNSNFSLLLTKP